MSKRNRGKRAKRRNPVPPRVPRPGSEDAASATARAPSPESRARRMQRTARAARESMISVLDLLLSREELTEWMREYVGISGIDLTATELFDDPVFLEWLLYFAGDSRMSRGMLQADTAAARYLEGRYGPDERRRFIDLARRQPVGFWRVVSVGPGPWVTLSDMTWRREQRVFDPELARDVAVGRALLAHVVADDDVAIIAARAEEDMGPWPQYWVRLLAERAAAHMDVPERLMGYDIEVIQLYGAWRRGEEELLRPVKMTIEGHPTRMTTLDMRYEGWSLERLLGALAEAPDFELDVPVEAASILTPVGWNGEPLEGGPRLLPHGVCGVLFVSEAAIRAHTSSAERTQALIERLNAVLGEPSTQITMQTEEPPQPGGDEDRTHDGDTEPVAGTEAEPEAEWDIEDLDPEGRLETLLRDDFLAWADEPHPSLGDRSPREVVAEPEGATRVRAILDGWQARARRLDLSYHDFDALRASLGLATAQG